MEGSNAQEQDNNAAVDAVFRDFQGRREALVKALTTEFEEFCRQCDPVKGVDLCLYGLEDGRWEVKPLEPPVIPNPPWGFNIVRDLVDKYDWARNIAAASDSWLLSVAFFLGAVNSFNQADRNRLFTMINALPTLYEIVGDSAKEEPKDKSSDSDNPSSKRAKSTEQAGLDLLNPRATPSKQRAEERYRT